MKSILKIFSPNQAISKSVLVGMVIFQLIILIALWFTSPPLVPKPLGIVKATDNLVRNFDLIPELVTSLKLSLEAMLITVVISLFISYATVLPFFRPIAFIVSKFRFLTLVGLSFLFTIMTGGGHELKVWLLVFGMTVFFTTSMVSVLNNITRVEFNHIRTLRFSEWGVVKELIVLGKFDAVFEIIRQNFAISWMMLTLVEGISRAEGGIGTLLLNQNKHFRLDEIFAIQIVILLVGIFQDYIFGVLKQFFCPHSSLALQKK